MRRGASLSPPWRLGAVRAACPPRAPPFLAAPPDPDPAGGGRLMPNTFAYAMLLIWPLVALWLFKKLPRAEALIWTLVAGYLLLPAGTAINLPVLPALSKANSPAFAGLIMCLAGVGGAVALRRRRAGKRNSPEKASSGAGPAEPMPGWLPRSAIGKLLFLAMVFGPLATGVLNTDQINFSYGGFIVGLKPYDALAGVMNSGVLLLPMLLARKYLASAQNNRLLLRILMLAGLAYSLPMLIEVRLSPQLHVWFYGFFPHSFAQTYRFGGFRPVVFLGHGLVVALFTAMAFLAAAALWRTASKANRPRLLLATLWLAVMLVLCKSVGSLVVATLIAPMILILGRRTQMLAAVAIAAVVLLYPTLRGGGVMTAPGIISVTEKLMPGKVGSISLRVVNEDQLLARAAERPLFGWGGWGRPRVYDKDTGQDVSVTDGAWVIIIGENGWLGYLSTFGLLTLPIFGLFRLRADPQVTLETTALCLILSLNLLDLLPNSGLTLLTWLLAGALLGRAEQIAYERSSRLSQRHEARRAGAADAPPPKAKPDPRPLRGSARAATAPGRGGGDPTKARVAPQHASGYPSPDDAPPRRRPPSGRTRR
jgi:hypothetical protein